MHGRIAKKAAPRPAHYIVKGPWEKHRASVAIQQVFRDESSRKRTSNYRCPEIIELNQQFTRGAITLEQVRAKAYEIRDALNKRNLEEQNRHLNKDNIAIFESYVSAEIRKKVNILEESRASQTNAAWRVIRLMGKTSLAKASHNEIQRVLDTITTEGSFKHSFKTVRSILAFINRHKIADALHGKRFTQKEPPFLTREQVGKVIDHIPSEVQKSHPHMADLLLIIFNLGLRISEALAIEKADVGKLNGVVVVHITKQLARPIYSGQPVQERIRATKNKRNRPVMPLDKEETLQSLARWLKEYPNPHQRETYRYRASNLVHELAQKLFGINVADEPAGDDEFFFDEASLPDMSEQREMKAIHMLRAGHAVHIIETTGNEVFAANQIGDNPEVLRRHYSGRINTARSMKLMAEMLSKR